MVDQDPKPQKREIGVYVCAKAGAPMLEPHEGTSKVDGLSSTSIQMFVSAKCAQEEYFRNKS